MTVPACRSCNSSWADDEAHFRNILIISGESNAAVHELWQTSVRRSIEQIDGHRRLSNIVSQMVPVEAAGEQRWMVYPARDESVLRVLKKVVIRGLSHFHGLESAVPDERVWVDVMRYRIPDYLLSETKFLHREADICEYWYESYGEGELSSVWFLRLFEKREFVASIRRT